MSYSFIEPMLEKKTSARLAQADLLVALADDHLVAQRLPQEIERGAQRAPVVLGVQLRPEETEQLASPRESLRDGDAQVGMNGGSLPLCEWRVYPSDPED